MTAATGEPQGNQWVGAEWEPAERHLESQKRLNVTEEDGEWEMDAWSPGRLFCLHKSIHKKNKNKQHGRHKLQQLRIQIKKKNFYVYVISIAFIHHQLYFLMHFS